MKSKFNLIFILSFLSIILVFSCNKPENIDPPDDNSDTTEIEEPSEVELKLMEYSWIDCNYDIRFADSSLHNMNEFYLPETCSKQIFTYASDKKYHTEDFCDGGNHYYDYWILTDEEDRIMVFLDENFRDLDHTCVIEKLNNDSLKLFIPTDESDNLVEGLFISFYSTEKKEY